MVTGLGLGHTSLESMGIDRLWRVVQHLVEAHWVGTELIEEVRLVPQAHCDGTHDGLGQRFDPVEVVHTDLFERLAESLRPDIRTVGKLSSNDLGMIQRKIAGHIVALFEVRTSVRLNHLTPHDFVATII